jgi:hypothetical protein
MSHKSTAPSAAPTALNLPAEPFLDAAEAVEVYREHGIKKTRAQLAKERHEGSGAEFYKDGRLVRYIRSAIIADIAARHSGPFRSAVEHKCRPHSGESNQAA